MRDAGKEIALGRFLQDPYGGNTQDDTIDPIAPHQRDQIKEYMRFDRSAMIVALLDRKL